MKLYSENNSYKLYNGNMLDMLEVIEPNSIDAVITDPPYGLTSITKRFGKENSAPAQFGTDGAFSRLSKGFMGKEWDGSGIEYNVDAWRKCYEVLKPGGYLLAFGGTRTFHRIACAIEDAGFEIRDTIMWLYGSGFPKSMNIGLAIDKKLGIESEDTGEISPNARPNSTKDNTLYESGTVGKSFTIKKATNEWAGWGTALKPAYEPIIVARKPFSGSLVDNVLANGVGGLNIDECRISLNNGETKSGGFGKAKTGYQKGIGNSGDDDYKCEWVEDKNGRFPANVILTYDETDEQEVCGGMPNTTSGATMRFGSVRKKQDNNCYKLGFTQKEFNDGQNAPDAYGDDGSAARYFYCAKASKRDRDEGCQDLEDTVNACSNQAIAELKRGNDSFSDENNSTFNKVYKGKNTHPTVKPVELMQYLIRLVCPKGATILDPFNGSGSTGKAVMYENNDHNKGYKYIGIELTDEYLPISKARIECAYYDKERLDSKVVDKVDNVVYENATLFDLLGA